MTDEHLKSLERARARLVASRRRHVAEIARAAMDGLETPDLNAARALVERQAQIDAVDKAFADEQLLSNADEETAPNVDISLP